MKVFIVLKFVLGIIVVYFIFRLLIRYVFPYLGSYYLKRFQRKFYDQNPHLNKDPIKKTKNNEMNTDHIPDKKKEVNDIGEYIDFEEIE